VLFAILLGFAANARLDLGHVALTDADTWGWLDPALSWVGGTGFHETYEREWLYGAFLAGCFRLTGSFAGMVMVQQVLGLLAGLLLWSTWQAWSSLLPKDLVFQIVGALLGLFVSAVVLLNPNLMVFELCVRPEGIMGFLIFAQFLCITLYCRYRWREPNAVLSVIFGSLAIPLAYTVYVLKPSWALAVPATLLPIALGLLMNGQSFSIRCGPPALGGLIILVALFIPEKVLFKRSDEPHVVLAMTLFTMNADSIAESYKKAIASKDIEPDRKVLLEQILPVVEMELVKAREWASFYPRVGFDPDYLMYRASIFPTLVNERKMSKAALADFCKESYFEAWRNNPQGMLSKVTRQMPYFITPDRQTFYRHKIPFKKLLENTLATTPEKLVPETNAPTQAMYAAFRAEVETALKAPRNLEGVRAFDNFTRLLTGEVGVKAADKTGNSWTSFAIASLWLVAILVCVVAAPLRYLVLPGFVAGILYFGPLGNAITIALVHALDNDRYRASYGAALFLALAAMLYYALIVLCEALYVILDRRKR
jgi:hypothetical protein